MKILVVNLLRLGDFIQCAPVIEGLRTKHHTPWVDVLTFKSTAGLEPMMTGVDRWWTLDRDALQKGLGQADIPLLTPLDVLREQLDAIAAEDYDLIVNLSHTEFAGWVTGYLPAREKIGVSYDPQGRAHFHSPWFRYVNAHAGRVSENVFNYVDIFFEACELRGQTKSWPFRITTKGQAELDALELTADPLLLVQPGSSDARKNWPAENFVRALGRVRAIAPQTQVVVLGSPAECEASTRLALDAGAKVAIVSLEGALALLRRADVLLTGDTSIKHLAAASSARVLELCLGPSDFARTGSYPENSLLLVPQLGCAPCAHTGACGEPSQRCAEMLKPELVSAAVCDLLREDWSALKDLSQRTPQIAFKRTRHLRTGYWFAADLNSEAPAVIVDQWLERSSWRFFLNQEDRLPITTFGSEGVHLHDALTELGQCPKPLLAHLDFREGELERQSRPNRGWRSGIGQLALSELRQQQNQVEADVRRARIQLKLVRSLKTRIMEHS